MFFFFCVVFSMFFCFLVIFEKPCRAELCSTTQGSNGKDGGVEEEPIFLEVLKKHVILSISDHVMVIKH